MKKMVIVWMMMLGFSVISQTVWAEKSGLQYFPSPEGAMADDQPFGNEDALEEGSEDDGVTERGLRRFRFPGKKFPSLKKRPKIKKGFKVPKSFRLRKPLTQTPPGTPPPGSPPPPPPPAQQCEWKTSDIIDQRIEISAQQSLMRMMGHGSIEEKRAASAMIGAIKNGTLAGIHAPFLGRKAVADRAASVPPPGTKGYWSLLQPGQIGMCLQEPNGVPPMLLYREKNQHPSVIDHTLRTKWAECGLPTPDPPCSFVVDLHKPSPPDPDPTEGQPPEVEPNDNETTSLIVTLMKGANLYQGKARVFVLGNNNIVQTGQGTVVFVVEPGSYNAMAQEFGLTNCKFGPPKSVTIGAGESVPIFLQVPSCAGP